MQYFLVDGATHTWRRLIRKTPLVSSSHCCRSSSISIEVSFFQSRSSHCCRFSSLDFEVSFFQSIFHKSKRTVLYKPPSGFEPTTFLIHDLIQKHDELDRSTTTADFALFYYLCNCTSYCTYNRSFKDVKIKFLMFIHMWNLFLIAILKMALSSCSHFVHTRLSHNPYYWDVTRC